jgi:hypothetical protein
MRIDGPNENSISFSFVFFLINKAQYLDQKLERITRQSM